MSPKEARTLSISDMGIGMSRDEVMEGVPDNRRLAAIGVSRISYGATPYIEVIGALQERTVTLYAAT